jgi:lysozyme family protein
MMKRRDVMRWAMGASVGALLGGRAFAQDGGTQDIFGLKVPNDILDVLPAKPVTFARTLAAIVALEREADTKKLPISVLSWSQPTQQYPTSEASLYQSALPRLVSLIDRSETQDPAMAEQAGAILADIHNAQRVVPDALKPVGAVPMSRNRDFASLKSEYARLFGDIGVRSEFNDTAQWHLSMMKKSRTRYEAVGAAVAVPWYFIAAIHGLEASFNFRAHLHNGDYPLSSRTRQVPSGRPSIWLPPVDWESSAKDALKLLGFANQQDWSLERTLYRLEAPYLWSFSNHYERGKFVADGSWNPKARSQQCGAAVMLKLAMDAGEVTGLV